MARARLRQINLAPETTFDVGDESRLNQANSNATLAAYDQARKAKLDLAIAKAGEQDMALARQQAAAKLVKEGQREGVMQNYIRDRETIPQIPVGVVNPQYLAKPQMGPQEQGASQIDLSPIERKARLDLSQISPDYSETFRTGMDTERETIAERNRKAEDQIREGVKQTADINKGNAEIKRGTDTLEETKRHNKATEWLTNLGLIKKTEPKPMDPFKKAKFENSAKGSVNELNATADVIDRLIGNEYKGIQSHPGFKGLTGYSSRVPYDVNQNTVNAEALRQQLLAKSAFAELQKMRQNSPTGGALGQVSDKEGEMLKNAAAALQRGQSPEQFRTNLEKFRAQLRISKQRIADAYKQDFGEDLPDDSQVQSPDVNEGDWE